MLSYLIFAVSIAVLVKSADYFTGAAEKLGVAFRLPPFIVGVTFVAVGTSLPELVSSILAAVRGSPDIVIGNVIGSNITNIFLIIGLAAIVAKQMKLSFELQHVDMPILLGAVFLGVFILLDGMVSRFDAVLLLLLLIVYLAYTMSSQKEVSHEKRGPVLKPAAVLVASAVFIYVGAEYTVRSVQDISVQLGVAEGVIAITAVALGTSLPELIVSVRAALKGNAELAIGNVLGSNIFNMLGVLSIPALISPLVIDESLFLMGVPLLIVASLLLFFITLSKNVTRWEGFMLLIFYLAFLAASFGSVITF